MCPCASPAPTGCCSAPAAAPTNRRCSRSKSSYSISTATSCIIPAGTFRWNGAFTPAFTATGPRPCALPICTRATRPRSASPATRSSRCSCTVRSCTAACRPGTIRAWSSTTSRPPTSRARSATGSRCRCAATAAWWWARAPRRRSSAAPSSRRTPASNWRPRSWAGRSRSPPDEARDCSESTYNPRLFNLLWSYHAGKVALASD